MRGWPSWSRRPRAGGARRVSPSPLRHPVEVWETPEPVAAARGSSSCGPASALSRGPAARARNRHLSWSTSRGRQATFGCPVGLGFSAHPPAAGQQLLSATGQHSSSAFHGTASSGDLPRRSRHPRVRCGNPGVDNRRGEGGLRGPLCSLEPVLGPTVSSSSQPEDLGHEVTRRVPPDSQSDPKYPC